MAIEVGDVVNYVPDVCHARIPDKKTGRYPFKFGVKKSALRGKESAIEEIPEGEVGRMLSNPRSVEKMAILSAQVTWSARVNAVNDDGTYNIDVKQNCSDFDEPCMVTLHCDNVREDASGKTPHTIHS